MRKKYKAIDEGTRIGIALKVTVSRIASDRDTESLVRLPSAGAIPVMDTTLSGTAQAAGQPVAASPPIATPNHLS